MFNETSGGNLFIFFIGLIIVFSILFNGGGGLFGGNARDVVAVDQYDRLLASITGTYQATSNQLRDIQDRQVDYTNQSTLALINNNNQQTRDVIGAVAGVQSDIAGLAYSNLQQENNRLAIELSQVKSEKYMDGIASANAAALCDIRNQITTLAGTVLTKPEFNVAGGTPIIGCSNFPRSGCGCGHEVY